MSEKENHPSATHYAFPYFFSDVDGINWNLPTLYEYDLNIYYGDDNYIECRCSRWDVDNYMVIVETWLKKSDLDNLLDNTTPGAVAELYTILGEPLFYDKTWTASNTIKFLPSQRSRHMKRSTLGKMRRSTVIYPKNITTSPVKGASQWTNVKIEGYVSSNQYL